MSHYGQLAIVSEGLWLVMLKVLLLLLGHLFIHSPESQYHKLHEYLRGK